MNVAQKRLSLGTLWLGTVATILLLVSVSQAQSSQTLSAHSSSPQSATTVLSSLPEADTIIYASPQRILNDAAPKVISASELAKLRASFVDIKKNLGVDPASIDVVAIAVRFHKPAADLSFVPPDLLAVVSGDFSADSMLTLAGVFLQDNARAEKYGSKTLTIMKIDPIAEAAQKNPLLKSFVEMGAVALNSNTLAVGNISYVKAAVDASEGTGRISSEVLNSLLRDPNALVSAAGSPLTAFAKSFGIMGTQNTKRESCPTHFGDFYAAITMDGTNFNLRGAMNTDNPDTAKIINGLLASVLQPAIGLDPRQGRPGGVEGDQDDAEGKRDRWEADVPQQVVATMLREQTQAKPSPPTEAKPTETSTKKPVTKPRRRARRN
jgi:hypothetical protein